MIISDLSYLEDVFQESNETVTTIPHGGRAAVFLDNGYVGLLGTFKRGSARFSSKANDQVSSIKVTPGEIWQVCVDADYKGKCVLIDRNYPDIDAAGLPNDSMSSIRKL